VRQLITRVPDELHEQLRRTAQVRGQSVNELVVGVLSDAVGHSASRADVRSMLRSRGLLVTPPESSAPPSHADLAARHAGRGPALADALEEDRAAR
jgi:hypothetical protein